MSLLSEYGSDSECDNDDEMTKSRTSSFDLPILAAPPLKSLAPVLGNQVESSNLPSQSTHQSEPQFVSTQTSTLNGLKINWDSALPPPSSRTNTVPSISSTKTSTKSLSTLNEAIHTPSQSITKTVASSPATSATSLSAPSTSSSTAAILDIDDSAFDELLDDDPRALLAKTKAKGASLGVFGGNSSLPQIHQQKLSQQKPGNVTETSHPSQSSSPSRSSTQATATGYNTSTQGRVRLADLLEMAQKNNAVPGPLVGAKRLREEDEGYLKRAGEEEGKPDGHIVDGDGTDMMAPPRYRMKLNNEDTGQDNQVESKGRMDTIVSGQPSYSMVENDNDGNVCDHGSEQDMNRSEHGGGGEGEGEGHGEDGVNRDHGDGNMSWLTSLPSDFFDEGIEPGCINRSGEVQEGEEGEEGGTSNKDELRANTTGAPVAMKPLPGTEHLPIELQLMLRGDRKLYRTLLKSGQLKDFGSGGGMSLANSGSGSNSSLTSGIDGIALPSIVTVDRSNLLSMSHAERAQAEFDDKWRAKPVQAVEASMWDAKTGQMVKVTEATRTHKQKHQLTHLAAQAKAMEGRVAILKQNAAMGRMKKQQNFG